MFRRRRRTATVTSLADIPIRVVAQLSPQYQSPLYDLMRSAEAARLQQELQVQQQLTWFRIDRARQEQQAAILEHQYQGLRQADLAQQGLYQATASTMATMANPLSMAAVREFLLPYRHPQISVETAAQARERSRGLLKSLLSPEQWASFERTGRVKERIDGCEFTLTPGGMIEARRPRLVGTVKERWCVAPDPYADGNDWMPAEDKLIGQLLHLRAGPDKLRAKANVWPL